MRELVLDTETTGLYHEDGDRIVEIGIVELENHVQTGNTFHYYLNPQKDSSLEALKVHGLTKEFLANKPKFEEIVDEFLEFIEDSRIIIHNASFDIGFINSELKRLEFQEIPSSNVVDTMMLARSKFRGQSVSLDSLCRKFKIDLSERDVHGALKDAKLLSLVYLELIGGKQTSLQFENKNILNEINLVDNSSDIYKFHTNKVTKWNKSTKLDPNDLKLHLGSLKDIPNSIWKKINS